MSTSPLKTLSWRHALIQLRAFPSHGAVDVRKHHPCAAKILRVLAIPVFAREGRCTWTVRCSRRRSADSWTTFLYALRQDRGGAQAGRSGTPSAADDAPGVSKSIATREGSGRKQGDVSINWLTVLQTGELLPGGLAQLALGASPRRSRWRIPATDAGRASSVASTVDGNFPSRCRRLYPSAIEDAGKVQQFRQTGGHAEPGRRWASCPLVPRDFDMSPRRYGVGVVDPCAVPWTSGRQRFRHGGRLQRVRHRCHYDATPFSRRSQRAATPANRATPER